MSDDVYAMLKRQRDAMWRSYPETIPDQGDRFNIPSQGDNQVSEYGNGPFIIMHEHFPNKELVSLPGSKDTITALWEIARQVAEDDVTIASAMNIDLYCVFCDGHGSSKDFHHDPSCIVLKSRVLLKDKGV